MANAPADIKLIDGCINNNRAAQEQLYKQFYGPMASICLRYTKNEEDAIEVLHNGFLKVFKKIHTYDGSKASLYTWIRTIIVHSAIDFIRQRGKFHSQVELEKAEEASIDADAVQKNFNKGIIKAWYSNYPMALKRYLTFISLKGIIIKK